MANAVITAGSEVWGKAGTFDIYAFETTTGANAEDGVDVKIPMTKIIGWGVCGAAAGKYGPFFATLSGVTLTIKGAATTAADAALVKVVVFGYK
ncbi:MAG: hypothetical protein FD189_1105 [Elusimicrobia bacterium]|nr:MAG: hypothetical protein FD189_1105 [Elusimicrobiota bacterium]